MQVRLLNTLDGLRGPNELEWEIRTLLDQIRRTTESLVLQYPDAALLQDTLAQIGELEGEFQAAVSEGLSTPAGAQRAQVVLQEAVAIQTYLRAEEAYATGPARWLIPAVVGVVAGATLAALLRK